MKQILSTTKVLLLALVLSFGLSYVYAWTAPSANPPSGNVSAPLNTGATDQTKTGSLTVSATTTSKYFADFASPTTYFIQPSNLSTLWSLNVVGTTTTNGIKLLTGAGAGKVLTSDASGNASWQAQARGPGSMIGFPVCYPTSAVVVTMNLATGDGALAARTYRPWFGQGTNYLGPATHAVVGSGGAILTASGVSPSSSYSFSAGSTVTAGVTDDLGNSWICIMTASAGFSSGKYYIVWYLHHSTIGTTYTKSLNITIVNY